MNKIHEKSLCCGAVIYRFGQRRRQCSGCRKTWRVWQRKRGRNERRIKTEILLRYFHGDLPWTSLDRHTRAARLRKILYVFNEKTPWHPVPDGPLIAIADGLVEYFNGKKYTLYLILLRSVSSHQAVILPPYLKIGTESGFGWYEALIKLPKKVHERIIALVCDGHTGLISVGQRFSWLVQRCHFHLLSRIEHCMSFGPRGKNIKLAIKLKKLTQCVLYRNDHEVIDALNQLAAIKPTITSSAFRTVISGLLKHYRDYRRYLEFPLYCLPTTSNSAEHLVGLIRDLQYRAKGFRTSTSFMAWATGLCKHKKTITCRPKIQPN